LVLVFIRAESAADSGVQMLRDKQSSIVSQIKCGAVRSAAVSVLALAMPVLMVLFHVVFKN